MLETYYNELIEKEYTPFCVCLTGSQCYNLADNSSDIDAVAFVIPSFVDICNGGSLISEQIEMSTGSFCTLIDIRKIPELFLKGDFIHYIPLFEDTYVPEEFLDDFNSLQSIIIKLGDFNKAEILKKAMGMGRSNRKKISNEILGWNVTCGKAYVYIRWLYYFSRRILSDGWDVTSGQLPYKVNNSLREEWLLYKRGRLFLNHDTVLEHTNSLLCDLADRFTRLMEEQKYTPDYTLLNPLYNWRNDFVYNYYWRNK